MKNLLKYSNLSEQEIFKEIIRGNSFKVKKIVSPPMPNGDTKWYKQEEKEHRTARIPKQILDELGLEKKYCYETYEVPSGDDREEKRQETFFNIDVPPKHVNDKKIFGDNYETDFIRDKLMFL